MALSANVKQLFNKAMANPDVSATVVAAIDANTLKTGISSSHLAAIIANSAKTSYTGEASASVTTTTTEATTTNLHTMVKALVANMKTARLMGA